MSGGQLQQVAQSVSQQPMAMGNNDLSQLIQQALSQSMQQPMQQMPQQMPQGFPGMQPGMGYDPMMAIAQMQRQPVQQAQNPFFGGAIPIDFGLPQASQIPAGYQSAMAAFRPSPFNQQNLPSFRNQGNDTGNDGYYVANYDMQGE
jgi:hypothetical protein